MKRLLIILLACFTLSACLPSSQKSSPITEAQPSLSHFAIIPHFMLNSVKVDRFYQELKTEYFPSQDPEQIIIISPNHFHPRSQTPQTICERAKVIFRTQESILSPLPKVSCQELIFYPYGEHISTKEHGIGEHLLRINKYFPKTQQIFPLILPTHKKPNT